MSLNIKSINQNGNMTIADFMIPKIIKIKGDFVLTKAAKLMIKNNIGSVLVELKNKKYSIITKTDIIRIISEDKDPTTILIKEVVDQKELLSCFPSDSLEDAMLKMAKYKIERLIVIDPQNNKILGIISSSDLLRIAPGLLEIKREEQYLTEASSINSESFAGYCDSCSNFDEQLKELGGFALCKECYEKKDESLTEDITDDDTTM